MNYLQISLKNKKYIQRDRETLTGFLKRVITDLPYSDTEIPVKKNDEIFGVLHYSLTDGAWFAGSDPKDSIKGLVDCKVLKKIKEKMEAEKFISQKSSSDGNGPGTEYTFYEKGWYKK